MRQMVIHEAKRQWPVAKAEGFTYLFTESWAGVDIEWRVRDRLIIRTTLKRVAIPELIRILRRETGALTIYNFRELPAAPLEITCCRMTEDDDPEFILKVVDRFTYSLRLPKKDESRLLGFLQQCLAAPAAQRRETPLFGLG